jgi:glutamine cyclotransferase
MHHFKFFILINCCLFIFRCGNSNKTRSNFSLEINAPKNILTDQDTLRIKLINPKQILVDSVVYTLDNTPITALHNLSNGTLGEKMLKAKIFSNNTSEVVLKKIIVVNSVSPKIYTYEIVNIYDHDITSYTQGLEFYGGELYESTGQYGESKLRKVNYKTAEVLRNHDLEASFFGEGMTIFDNKVYQLTWKAGRGFIYDVDTFEQIETFRYGQSKEGWGVCNNGEKLFKSDGTEYIWTLNPETLVEESYIQAYTNKGRLTNLNELEWVEDKIYANRYLKNGVAVINPKNGAIEAVIDFKKLKQKVTNHPGLDVLNGMAYNTQTKTLFVTGKRWDKLFEVRIISN